MRCFLALLLDRETRDRLSRIQAGLAGPRDGIRWVRPDHLHLTLQFLGEQDDIGLAELGELLSELPTRSPLELTLGQVDLLGSPSRPRVVYMGIGGDLDRLRALVSEIATCVELALGLPPEKRAWLPHITLGRIKHASRGLSDRLHEVLLRHSYEPGWTLSPVSSIALMQSELTPTGAIYHRRREFCFSDRARGG